MIDPFSLLMYSASIFLILAGSGWFLFGLAEFVKADNVIQIKLNAKQTALYIYLFATTIISAVLVSTATSDLVFGLMLFLCLEMLFQAVVTLPSMLFEILDEKPEIKEAKT